jgi:hypothetical protein
VLPNRDREGVGAFIFSTNAQLAGERAAGEHVIPGEAGIVF